MWEHTSTTVTPTLSIMQSSAVYGGTVLLDTPSSVGLWSVTMDCLPMSKAWNASVILTVNTTCQTFKCLTVETLAKRTLWPKRVVLFFRRGLMCSDRAARTKYWWGEIMLGLMSPLRWQHLATVVLLFWLVSVQSITFTVRQYLIFILGLHLSLYGMLLKNCPRW